MPKYRPENWPKGCPENNLKTSKKPPWSRGQNKEKLMNNKEQLVFLCLFLRCFLYCLRFFRVFPWICVREGSPNIPSNYPSNPPKSFPYEFPLFWPLIQNPLTRGQTRYFAGTSLRRGPRRPWIPGLVRRGSSTYYSHYKPIACARVGTMSSVFEGDSVKL